ncbi:ABC transporter substrate-binding protein [Microbacterium sp. C7(2022)]|uniref:ABC transporter substrate-binding protein n=1 Tax=Microbacterium sp. C7(2022) TaxID=2992759 RepID=UPI0027E370CF|nr:ABC transporter substrate-binding protein [Microbacterium sp. C7(2022)]
MISASLRRAATVSAVVAAAALTLSACAFSSEGPSSSAGVEEGELATLTPGTLTIATGDPAYEPWVSDNDPASGEGFEAAVAYAVAEELGFAAEDVVWVRSTFDSAIAPGPKDWDLNIQQFSVTEERKNAVDFSSPYYVTAQAVVTTSTSPAASATSIDELSEYVVGAASGTTSYTIAADQLGTDNLQVFNNNDDVVAALNSGTIDAFVIDLPSAFYLSAAVLDDGVIVGQFADSSEGGDELAFVLPKDSELTADVTAAVDALEADGTLAALEQEWLSDAVDVPVLK